MELVLPTNIGKKRRNWARELDKLWRDDTGQYIMRDFTAEEEAQFREIEAIIDSLHPQPPVHASPADTKDDTNDAIPPRGHDGDAMVGAQPIGLSSIRESSTWVSFPNNVHGVAMDVLQARQEAIAVGLDTLNARLDCIIQQYGTKPAAQSGEGQRYKDAAAKQCERDGDNLYSIKGNNSGELVDASIDFGKNHSGHLPRLN